MKVAHSTHMQIVANLLKFPFDRVCFQEEKRVQILVGRWNKKNKEKEKTRAFLLTRVCCVCVFNADTTTGLF